MKRMFDIILSSIFLVLTMPIIFLLSIIIWLVLGTPIFFRQERPGLNGNIFELVKFRSMTNKLDSSGNLAIDSERLNWLGKFLRSSSLDELPELWNVLKGDMSLVGPRPERPELVAEFEKTIPGFRKRLRVRPGFAGLAQVRGRYSTRPRDKLRYDNLYIERMNPFLDLKLCLASFWTVIRGFPH